MLLFPAMYKLPLSKYQTGLVATRLVHEQYKIHKNILCLLEIWLDLERM